MTLEAGDTLPSELSRHLRADARLSVLYFMRTADCVICRGHVKRLLELAPAFAELGAELVLFAPDEQAPAWAHERALPLVLGPDAPRAAGFERTLGAVQQSGTVIVQHGRVQALRRATLPFQAFDERELLRILREAASASAAA